MNKSLFDPDQQDKDISSKIVAGLERISEAFKVLVWEKAKLLGLSPIQIQILIFVAYHKDEFCNVSHLAKEFNVTKPTISDAIRALGVKGLIEKNFSADDKRSYSIALTDTGKNAVAETEHFADPIKNRLQDIQPADLDQLFGTLSQLIYQLNRNGVLTVQRTCYACKFFEQSHHKAYCKLLEKELLTSEIRLDCPEYEMRNIGLNNKI